MPHFGVISIGDEEVGLVQVQEANFLGLHTIVLDRGPVWYADAVPALWWRQFFEAFVAAFPRRFGRFRRVMPELTENAIHRKLLEDVGLRLAKTEMIGHRSIWVDLSADEGARRAALHQKWRNALSQAQRSDLTVETDTRGEFSSWIVAQYAEDKARRDYPGPSPKLVSLLAEGFFSEGAALILRALKNGEPVAGVLILVHGRSATYQVGWTSEAGRAANATHLLLWSAMGELAAKGIRDFDLGGINPEQAEGVTRFKRAGRRALRARAHLSLKLQPPIIGSSAARPGPIKAAHHGPDRDWVWSAVFHRMKIELAPARRQRACVSSDICSRPADRRTTLCGIIKRATAIVRAKSMPDSGNESASAVPPTGTRALIGTLSGWGCMRARAAKRPARSSACSPMPTMPPQQTLHAGLTHAVRASLCGLQKSEC